MKKILFSLLTIAAFNTANAQTVIWSENFDDLDISDWTTFDLDGDGFEWSPVQSTDNNDQPVGTPVLTSASYHNFYGELYPDNWATTPLIDLTNADGTITLKYGVYASDPLWNQENYAVYVSTANDYENLNDFVEVFTESSIPGTETQRTIDLSAYAGSQIYISFRHYDITDMYRINIDNISVEAETLSTTNVSDSKVSVYPNPVKDEFKLNLSAAYNAGKTQVTVTDLTGKKVKTFGAGESYNVSDLGKGVYILKVTDGTNEFTQKLIKK